MLNKEDRKKLNELLKVDGESKTDEQFAFLDRMWRRHIKNTSWSYPTDEEMSKLHEMYEQFFS